MKWQNIYIDVIKQLNHRFCFLIILCLGANFTNRYILQCTAAAIICTVPICQVWSGDAKVWIHSSCLSDFLIDRVSLYFLYFQFLSFLSFNTFYEKITRQVKMTRPRRPTKIAFAMTFAKPNCSVWVTKSSRPWCPEKALSCSPASSISSNQGSKSWVNPISEANWLMESWISDAYWWIVSWVRPVQ